MKAAVYYETGQPDVFRYEDVPEPGCQPGRRTDRRKGDQHRGRPPRGAREGRAGLRGERPLAGGGAVCADRGGPGGMILLGQGR